MKNCARHFTANDGDKIYTFYNGHAVPIHVTTAAATLLYPITGGNEKFCSCFRGYISVNADQFLPGGEATVSFKELSIIKSPFLINAN